MSALFFVSRYRAPVSCPGIVPRYRAPVSRPGIAPRYRAPVSRPGIVPRYRAPVVLHAVCYSCRRAPALEKRNGYIRHHKTVPKYRRFSKVCRSSIQHVELVFSTA